MNKEEKEDTLFSVIVLALLASWYVFAEAAMNQFSPEPYQSECTDVWVHSSSPEICE